MVIISTYKVAFKLRNMIYNLIIVDYEEKKATEKNFSG